MLERKAKIDVFISSPAKRALKTARIFANAYGRDDDDIVIHQELYLPAAPVFFDIIGALDDEYRSAAIFSHNNGITEFANMLGVALIDNIPTCGIFAVSANTETWSAFRDSKKEFLFFDYPKKYE
jgi:phosphohistidine phosphatase